MEMQSSETKMSSPPQETALASLLKSKRICRFCMSQKEPLTNIYSKENRVNSSAPLPLQVMACVSIEVFSNDGMPSTICEACRSLMEFCYKFKQMCKKSDNSLRQFPLTGKWPDPLETPKIPETLQKKEEPKKQTILNSLPIVKVEEVTTCEISTQQVEQPKSVARRPKILNKSSVKILNKNVNDNPEPVLSNPIITRNESGRVEIVTEIIDHSETRVEEPDPVLSAEPVETNVFPCPNCERSFPLRQLLDIHMVNHSRERSFVCEVCEKRFFSKYDLGKHMLIHTGEKPFQCVVCKKAFTRSTLLHRHEKIHIDQPKFLCVFCEKPFLSKKELEKHTDRHKKHRPFPCKVCGKSFAFKQGLERHETIHSKDQPFPCQYCELSFSTPSKLSRHLTAHAGERPFPCKLCPKSYLLSHHLTRHLRSHSQGSGSYKCYDCERNFVCRDDLIYHSAVHATQNLRCPLCKEQFGNLDQVTGHIKQHAEGEQYACEFCDLIFLHADKLQTHAELKHGEEMEAYEEHDKQSSYKREELSPHGSEQEEVLQEFIIEEYHEDESMKDEKLALIEEEVEVAEKEIRAPPKILNRQGLITRHSKARVSPQKASPQKFSDDSKTERIEIEAYTSSGADDDYQPDPEEESDDDENYEPPSKSIKVTQQITTRSKAAKHEKLQPTAGSSAALSIFKVPVKKETKMVQPTITTVLQQIPKSVTVVKRENKSSPPATVAKVSPGKEVRILNEKIIRKPTQVTAPAKTFKLSGIKTPVKVIERKSIPQPQTENVPAKRKESPTATQTKASPVLASEDKPTPKRTQPVQPSAGQQSGQPKKLVEMMIDNRKVKVQKIVMTKAEVAAMAKEGKIEVKGGTMILKQNGKSLAGKVISKSSRLEGGSSQ